uniref:Uncharacterized protein LOC104235200 n=1 Tax=Nicotiana sylvestris TaxID=4096 RepID=A0A1U7XC35_NICSY|nr:PREDICTED: uncharacterized protein LOC104235200 [Nicotiana sylvestris]
MPGLKLGTSSVRLATLGLAPGSPDEASKINLIPSATGKILAYVDDVSVYALENKLDDNVKVRDDTNMFPTIEVKHLIKIGSDHAPLLMTYREQTTNFVKPFRFLNFWTKHATFMDVVRQNWEVDFIRDPFFMFKQKLKRVKAALSKWSRETFGDIFKQLAILEDIVRVKEMLFEENPTIERRIVLQKAQSELKKYLSIEEQYWKQKSWDDLRIKSGSRVWIEEYEKLATTAVDFYQKQFTNEGDTSDFSFLNNVPLVVTMEQNLKLSKFPTIEEDVIGADIHNMVLHFYGGAALPKSITHTNIVLLPKKPRIETFSDLRLISLSNFINKVKPAKVVIKLDMAKAYDKVSWKYLLHVLRKMGFSEHFINMVWNLVSNNWSLNKLFEDRSFVGFGMPKWFDPLNHLAYADDTIIFASAHPPSLRKIMAVLGNYDKISCQIINKDKSSYYMYSKVPNGLCQAVGTITGFARGKFPFTYLGCPIFYTIRMKEYYEDLIKKIKAKLHSWKEKLLSFGGKATFISSVLQSMSVHMLSVLQRPKNVLEHLHKIFARFFWSTKEEGRSRYWASWKNLCLPKEEGGLCFRSLHDVSRALFAKLWWRFRTTKSLWSNFMWNKYCKKEIPMVVQFRQGSHVWRQMLNAREEVEHEILWELKSGKK